MSPEEFERIKNEEKAHLRQLRDLKRTHRDAQRKASSLDALNKMRNPALESEIDAGTEKLLRDAALSEARFDLALESQAPVTGPDSEADRETLAKAEAEALVRQMKAQLGAGGDATPSETAAQSTASPSAPADAKTIGRTRAPDDPAPPPRDAKSIGRPRQ